MNPKLGNIKLITIIIYNLMKKNYELKKNNNNFIISFQ